MSYANEVKWLAQQISFLLYHILVTFMVHYHLILHFSVFRFIQRVRDRIIQRLRDRN